MSLYRSISEPSHLVRLAVALAIASAAAAPVLAQEAGAEDEVKEVVVTGSRIVRPDFSSDSPTVSVSSQAFENTSQVSIDQQLNKMPQFVSGANQITSAGDGQATPTNTPGIATANLRGLGANRTLVLLDGRRTQPANASLVVDLNTIPAAAIDGVEIITGGAGSTYGADAVAGVVNFKLKRNFQGVTMSAQSGQTLEGDGAQSQISALLGSNFADNKGNAMIGLTYSKRDAVLARDREFFRRAFTDPGTPGADGFPNFGGYVPTAGQGYSQTAVDSVFGAKGYAAGDVKNSSSIYFLPGATTAQASLFSINAGSVSGRQAPGYTGGLGDYSYKYLTNGNLASNAPNGFLSSPLERYSAFANGHYDFNDNVSMYAQANFQNTITKTQGGASAPAVLQWGATVPYDAAHPVPTDLQLLLDSRGPVGSAARTAAWTLNKELDYMGQTNLTTKTNTYELLTGLRGNLGVKDWTYDFFASHGQTDMNQQSGGYVDLLAYQTLLNLPNYGANADFNNGRTGLLAHCTSGLNPFVTTPVSQDCINIITAPLKTTTSIEQEQVEIDVQGALFALPAGDFRFAVGSDYRKNTFDYEPDRNISTQNINSLTVGLFDTTRTVGQIGVKEGYVEALVPVLKDIPAVKALNLNFGYRYSDYDTKTGGVSTWKATADWDLNDYVKIRGGRQNANRAPNVAELFQPAVFSTVPWPDHDPCSIVTRAPYGNVATNPDRAKVQALCTTLSGGFPVDSNFNGNQSVYFPLGRDLTQGNLDLQPEEAKTFTLGTVLRSPFESDYLRHLTVSIDYYDIDLEDAISPATTQTVYQQCFNGLGTNPTYDPNNPYCKLIIRSPINGFWLATNAVYQNLGAVKTAGVDTQIDWNTTTPFIGGLEGTLSANVNASWLQKYDVVNFKGGPTTHYADTIGGPIGSPPYGAQFRWKFYTTVGYAVGPAGVNLAWRHLPSVRNVALATNATATQLPTPSYDLFDLSARWSFGSTYELRAGVDNLLNKLPLTVGILPGVTTSAGVTDLGSYDVLGRRFFVGGVAKF
ncbi:MAG: TonB-dependent receptor [Gammaproteobacteria bacterium]